MACARDSRFSSLGLLSEWLFILLERKAPGKAAIERLAEDPERGKPLQITLRGLRSWRTGNFRIVYRIFESRIEVVIVAVGHRREVYDRLRQRTEGGRLPRL